MTDDTTPDAQPLDAHATGDLVLQQRFDASREELYRAVIEPERLAAWFGPEEWMVPLDTVTIEPEVGGAFRFEMHHTENPEWVSAVNARFVEVVPGTLLVGDESTDLLPGGSLGLRLEFHDAEEGGATLVVAQGPYPDDFIPQVRAGWESSFVKLARLLAAG